ncbi:hypothetical protein ACTPOK_41110 [Streptomyces inhibens]
MSDIHLEFDSGRTSAKYEASGTTEAPMLRTYIGDSDDGKRCILTQVTAR